MSKIICLLENASDLINGIKFGPAEGVEGLVSEEVSESVASLFLSIPGYVLHGAGGEEGSNTNGGQSNAPAAPPAPKPETAAERKARLKAEKEAAEQEAAEKAEADRLAAEAEAKRIADEQAAAAEAEAARLAAEQAAADAAKNENGNGDEVF